MGALGEMGSRAQYRLIDVSSFALLTGFVCTQQHITPQNDKQRVSISIRLCHVCTFARAPARPRLTSTSFTPAAMNAF
jgi:hypothetical protein